MTVCTEFFKFVPCLVLTDCNILIIKGKISQYLANFSCCSAQGEVYTWGNNDKGQLGAVGGPRAGTWDVPRRMDLLFGWDVRGVACGAEHTVVITPSDVITWGSNEYGQCGHGERSEVDWVKPRSLKALHHQLVTQIVCGRHHTLCATATAMVYAWGRNHRGQLGLGDTRDRRSPTPVTPLWALPVQQLSAGESHSAALTSNGFMFTWGDNASGQLGLPASANFAKEKALTLSPSIKERRRSFRRINQRFLQAMADMGIPKDQAELALAETGNVSVEVATEWLFSAPPDVIETRLSGEEIDENPGHGSPTASLDILVVDDDGSGRVLYPRRVPLQGVRSIGCGSLHTVAVTDVEVYSWGAGYVGQLGHGNFEDAAHPQAIEALKEKGVKQVAAGRGHTLFLCEDGTVYGCGDASVGALPAVNSTMDAVENLSELESVSSATSLARAPESESNLVSMMRTSLQLPSRLGPVGDCSSSIWMEKRPEKSILTNSALRKMDNEFHHVNLHEVSYVEPSPFCNFSSTDKQREFDQAFEDDLSGLKLECNEPNTPVVYSKPVRLNLNFLAPRKNSNGSSSAVGQPGRDNGNSQSNVKMPVVTSIAAGNSASAFLTRGADEFPEPPAMRLWQRLQAAVASARAAPEDDRPAHINPIAAAVERVFGCSAAISAAFGLHDAVGIDVELLENVQSDILSLEPPPADKLGDPQPQEDELHKALRRGIDALIRDLEANIRLLGTPERAQVVLSIMQSQLLGDSRCSNSVIPRVCNIVLAAPSTCRHLLIKWWSEYNRSLLESRVVKPLQKYLTDELFATKKLTVAVMNAIKVLAYVEEANQLGRRLPPECFYNELISEKLDVLDHYVAWRQSHDMPQLAGSADGPFSFCSYPFLLNPRAKSKLLHTEARIQMDQTVADARTAEHQNGSCEALNEDRILPPKLERHELGSSHNKKLFDVESQAIGRDESSAEGAGSSYCERNPPSYAESLHMDTVCDTTNISCLDSTNASSTQPAAINQDNMRPSVRRRTTGSLSQSVGLRWLLGRSNDIRGSEYSEEQTDSRLLRDQMNYDNSSLEIEERHGASGSGRGRLRRQGSFGLPSPEVSGFPSVHPEMCILRIRRNHLMEDALTEISRQRPRDLFKPLRVHFIGEDGVDAGGVKKEFFQLLMSDLLSPDHGMLELQQETNTFWFNPSSLEGDDEFFLLGLVVGLAVYNGVLLDFPLPIVLYRKILGQEVQLRDLEEVQPILGRSLRSLLQWEGPGSVEDVFCQSFTVDVEFAGQTKTIPLCPDGDNIPVTEENRRNFVDAYVDWWLNVSCHRQFESFTKGFLTLCGGPALQLFSATELERLVCGSPCLDFDALILSARYEGGYHAEHRVIIWLWDVVLSFSEEEQKLFLKFFAGTDRAPIGGLANLRMIVQRDGPDSNKLPRSHTCFNTLLLPSYRSKEKLEERLKLAIKNAEGFGLE